MLPSARYAIFTFTATATKMTKMTLLEMLDLTLQDTFCVEKSPTRSNIFYNFVYIDKNLELEIIFKQLIDEMKHLKHNVNEQLYFAKQESSVQSFIVCFA